MRRTKYVAALFLILLALFLWHCKSFSGKSKALPYKNLEKGISYVGMDECKNCHSDKHASYLHTGMAMSFDTASRAKSMAFFDRRAIVYDSFSNLWYKPFWKGDSMMVLEFRLNGKDTIHKLINPVSYIIGSGHHTNSHMVKRNGYLYQIPITFYVQSQKWDMAPGFEKGNNSRFNRSIGSECMSCHNSLADEDLSAENRYIKIPKGIECERCHGPGEIHVNEKKSGKFVDTKNEIDYSIVNPAKLPVEYQNDLCMRCHLQGISVLNEGKNFHDFKPGMRLNEVMKVYLPRFPGDDQKFIMASQADRLLKSACYKNGGLSCISCHDPHIAVSKVSSDVYNSKCNACHTEKKCSEKAAIVNENQNNCIQCHMPRSGSIDIPHVTITDHFIRKDYRKTLNNLGADELRDVQDFLKLECVNDPQAGTLDYARAYLDFYEKFQPQSYLLDSAKHFLSMSEEDSVNKKYWINYYYLKNDWLSVVKASNEWNSSNADDWTWYKIAQSYENMGDWPSAYEAYSKSVAIKKRNLAVQLKMAALLLKMGRREEVKEKLNWLLQENSSLAEANVLMAFVLNRLERNPQAAIPFLKKAIQLEPDSKRALVELLQIYRLLGISPEPYLLIGTNAATVSNR